MQPREVRKRWTEKLRSGEYQQGNHVLRVNDRFCCLGVLCDLAVKESVIPEPDKIGSYYHYADQKLHLPESVQQWAGLCHSSGRFKDPSPDNPNPLKWSFLSNLNDAGKSFAEIADVIDSEPEGLVCSEDSLFLPW